MNEFDKKYNDILQEAIDKNIINESLQGRLGNVAKNLSKYVTHATSSGAKKAIRSDFFNRVKTALVDSAGFSQSSSDPHRFNGKTEDGTDIAVIFKLAKKQLYVYDQSGSTADKIGSDLLEINFDIDAIQDTINSILEKNGYEPVDFKEISKKESEKSEKSKYLKGIKKEDSPEVASKTGEVEDEKNKEDINVEHSNNDKLSDKSSDKSSDGSSDGSNREKVSVNASNWPNRG